MALDHNTAAAFIASIPEGRWTAYGDVADAAGNRSAAQSIGDWLRRSEGTIPLYWRVINSEGEVPEAFIASAVGLPGDAIEARDRLAAEGVRFDGQRASLRCRYTVEQWRASGCPSGAAAVAERRASEIEAYVERRMAELPGLLEDLRSLITPGIHPADSVAINRAIIGHSPADIPAHNRLGRAYQDVGMLEHARAAFNAVLQLDPANAVATKRLTELDRTSRGHNT